MESSLQICAHHRPPPASEFSILIEPKNVPAVFHGCIKDWEAFTKWDPRNGGLDYLLEKAGSSVVEAMMSRSWPIFYGDLRSHERVPLPFSSFVISCKQHLENLIDIRGACTEPNEGFGMSAVDSSEACPISKDGASYQAYLAQVAILNFGSKGRSPLESLQEDIKMPMFLATKPLASINLWMNNARSRSSTHYDPHHNLLCVVAGRKQVVLWPPSASSFLYPMPIYGEASNHSAINIENPDFSIHSRAKHSMDYSQKVILCAGDALFIPEGWFHQVDSDDLTIAVNFWWQSDMLSSMPEHMDAYYLRRLLRRLVDKEMKQTLNRFGTTKVGEIAYGEPNNGGTSGDCDLDSDHQNLSQNSKENNHKHRIAFHQLDPVALQSLHDLISLVHNAVNVSGQSQNGSTCVADRSVVLEDDKVANILCKLEPSVLRKVLLAMVNNFPRTLEALILHMLSPVGAEILTQKFDEMDQLTSKEEQNEFYGLFYEIFDDQFAAMDAILNAKESFGFQTYPISLENIYLIAKWVVEAEDDPLLDLDEVEDWMEVAEADHGEEYGDDASRACNEEENAGMQAAWEREDTNDTFDF